LDEIVKFLSNAEKGIISVSKSIGPLLFTITAVLWLLFLYIYFRGITAYLREKGKVMTAEDADRLDDLEFVHSCTDEEEEELKKLKARRDELKGESILPYYIGGFIILLFTVLMLVRVDLVVMWLKYF